MHVVNTFSTNLFNGIVTNPGKDSDYCFSINISVVSFCQEKSLLLVRLPVGSEVPYTGCTFRYIDTTGQTVEEVPGERLDSRTIETVTPGKLHTFDMIVMCLP